MLETDGNAYNLTKTGANQISFVGAAIDAALGNITINQGVLAFQTSSSSMGDASKTVTVNAGGTLGFYNTSNVMNKVATLNGGTIWAESGSGTQNTFAGPITLSGAGGTVDASAGAVLNIAGAIGGAAALSKNGAGTATVAGANTYTGATMVNAGTLVLNRSFTSGSSVTIASGATMQLAQSATTPSEVVLKTPTLSIAGSGKLDVKDNKLIVTSTPIGSWNGSAYTGVLGMLASGYNGGGWNGGGIVTSMSSAIAPNVLTALAASRADDAGYAGSTFGGVSVSASNALVMYTWGGDANLDGTLNGDDYFQIDSHIGSAGSAFGYFNGDFNYDGDINGDDYFIIDSNIGTAQSSTPFPTSGGVASLAAVPEPAGIVAIAIIGAPAVLPRRRRLY
jgi:autotransporter-associated beta strand protein